MATMTGKEEKVEGIGVDAKDVSVVPKKRSSNPKSSTVGEKGDLGDANHFHGVLQNSLANSVYTISESPNLVDNAGLTSTFRLTPLETKRESFEWEIKVDAFSRRERVLPFSTVKILDAFLVQLAEQKIANNGKLPFQSVIVNRDEYMRLFGVSDKREFSKLFKGAIIDLYNSTLIIKKSPHFDGETLHILEGFGNESPRFSRTGELKVNFTLGFLSVMARGTVLRRHIKIFTLNGASYTVARWISTYPEIWRKKANEPLYIPVATFAKNSYGQIASLEYLNTHGNRLKQDTRTPLERGLNDAKKVGAIAEWAYKLPEGVDESELDDYLTNSELFFKLMVHVVMPPPPPMLNKPK